METIILAGGCFWCTETVFKSLKGVSEVVPGYSGGDIENPGYYEVASGESGHAESVKVTFDPSVISLETIFEVFFKLHDPTELNRQGADVGPQYRSAIFYADDGQKKAAEDAKKLAGKDHKNPIVTEITQYKNFYPAGPEHKDYYFKNKGNIYCTLVIDPKISKLRKNFAELIR
jgi:peptide-methionine (S)-S-oxide reductase